MEAGLTSHNRRLLGCGALALLVAVLYAPVARFDFVNYDDNDYVYANPAVTAGLTLNGARDALRFHAGHWHPLTWLTHMADVEWFGVDAGRHHLMNVALHGVNSVLLFLGLTALTGSPGRSAIAAALFAAHPLNVESVAWITQRKTLLSTAMWLLTIGAYVRWTRRPRAAGYALVCLSFAAGLMSKAMIVTLPATLLVLDLWPLRRLSSRFWTDSAGRRRALHLLLEKTPLFALAGIASFAAYSAQRAARAIDPSAGYPLLERALNACVSYLWYLQKAVVPAALTVINPHPSSVGELVSRPLALASLLLMGSLGVAAWWQFERRPWIAAGLSWYFVTLLPVSGIVQAGEMAHGDHFAYVPLIGVFVALVWTAADVIVSPRLRASAVALACVVLAMLGLASRRQLQTWRNSETLYTRVLQVHQGRSFIARKNLAAHYSELGSQRKAAGDSAGALRYFRAAGELHTEPGILYNEAVALTDLHRYAEAIPLYRRSLALDASNADAWLNLGDSQVLTNDHAGAVQSYAGVLERRQDKYALYGMAWSCHHLGNAPCAAASLAQLRSIDAQLANEIAARLQRAR